MGQKRLQGRIQMWPNPKGKAAGDAEDQKSVQTAGEKCMES
jgi:hypothetical protein